MCKRLTSLVLGAFMCALPVFAAQTTEYKINVPESIARAYEKSDIEALINLIYQPLNIKPTYYYFPSERGIKLLSEGQVDADAARFALGIEGQDNIIQIPIPLAHIQVALFCLEPDDCVEDENAKLGSIRGFYSGGILCQRNGMHCYFVDTYERLGKMLQSHRVQAAFLPTYLGASAMCLIDQKDIYIKRLTDFDRTAYHYVNNKHQGLVEPLTQSIRKVHHHPILTKVVDEWKNRLKQCGKALHYL